MDLTKPIAATVCLAIGALVCTQASVPDAATVVEAAKAVRWR